MVEMAFTLANQSTDDIEEIQEFKRMATHLLNLEDCYKLAPIEIDNLGFKGIHYFIYLFSVFLLKVKACTNVFIAVCCSTQIAVFKK